MDARTLERVLFVWAKLPMQAIDFIALSFPVLPLPVVFEYIRNKEVCPDLCALNTLVPTIT